MPAEKLPHAAYVALGMLRLGASSGYEIKRAVDLSIRFFWTISQAQIYPSLERFERAGLVRGRSEPRGKRPRRAYEVTGEGEAELIEWLRTDDPIPYEVRDLAMVKLFFADLLERDDALEILAAMRRRSEERIRVLRRESWPVAEAAADAGLRFPFVTLRIGIAVHEALVDSCAEMARELREGQPAAGVRAETSSS